MNKEYLKKTLSFFCGACFTKSVGGKYAGSSQPFCFTLCLKSYTCESIGEISHKSYCKIVFAKLLHKKMQPHFAMLKLGSPSLVATFSGTWHPTKSTRTCWTGNRTVRLRHFWKIDTTFTSMCRSWTRSRDWRTRLPFWGSQLTFLFISWIWSSWTKTSRTECRLWRTKWSQTKWNTTETSTESKLKFHTIHQTHQNFLNVKTFPKSQFNFI